MATQKCKDCGNQVSDQATQCPHCGAPRKRKSGCCLGVIACLLIGVLLIIVISVSFDQNPKPASSSPIVPPVTAPPQPARDLPEVNSTKTVEPIVVDWEARRRVLESQYSDSFVKPVTGNTISVTLTQGNTITGIVKALTENEILVQVESATIGLKRAQLSPESRSLCFATDYTASKAAAKLVQERVAEEAKIKAERDRLNGEQNKREEQKQRQAIISRVRDAQLVLNNWRWSTDGDYVIAEGQVKNVTYRKLDNVEALVQFRTAENEYITSDSALLEFTPLMPDQASPFKVIVRRNPLMKTASISFKTIEGVSLKHVSKDEYDQVIAD
jgi:hypothetical protein